MQIIAIPGNRITILRHLNEVMTQIQTLAATDCQNSADRLQKCEEELLGISIDVASACCPEKDWDFVSALLASVGIHIPSELDEASVRPTSMMMTAESKVD